MNMVDLEVEYNILWLKQTLIELLHIFVLQI